MDRVERTGALRQAFTLIELILVMALFSILLSVTAPSLSKFFRGRTLDSEAQRFLGLTRYGQNRAVSEGVPMVLWLDPQRRAYGLEADSSYLEQDSKEVEFDVNQDLQLEVKQPVAAQRRTTLWKGNGRLAANLPKIRFDPDGSIGDTSPELLSFRQGEDDRIWIQISQNRMNYEIVTNLADLQLTLRR